jgi:lysophospholipase L1-like esterase
VITPSYNVGYGGYTCENVLAEASTMSSAFAPSTVVLVCGENDFGSDSRSTADTFALFTQIVDAYLAGGARVVYIGTKPEPGTTELHAQYKEYDALIAKLAADRAAGGGLPPLTMIDSNAGFVAAGNGADLYSGDELHLSPAGYSLWESWLTAAVTPTADDVNCYLWRSGSCVAGGADATPTTSPTDPADSAATMKPAMLGLVLSLVVALL